MRARSRAAGGQPARARVSMSWDGIGLSEKNAPGQVRVLRGRWPLVGSCCFCSKSIGTAIALIITPDRLGAVCASCDYCGNIAQRISEIACRYGHIRRVALSNQGLA
jgi:hypothetical protein